MFSIFHSHFVDDSQSAVSTTDAKLCKKNNEEREFKRDFSAESQNNRFSRFSHSLDASENPSTTESLTAEFLEKCAESPIKEVTNPNLLKDFEFKSKLNAERLESDNSVRKKMMTDHESHSHFPSSVENLNIITSREQIDFMTNECVTKNFAERDKILTLKNRTLGSDICKRRFENLCFQQKEFDEFVGSLKTYFLSKQAVLDSGCTESVLKIVQKECDLFKHFFPAYGFRRKILNTVAKNQVTIISADSAYFCNIAVPILLSHEYSNHSIFACESNEVLSQILQEKIYHVTSKQTAEDQELYGAQILVFSEKLLLDHLCYTSFFCDTSFCITLNLSLKRSIIADILLADILDLLVSCTNSKLILLLPHYDSVSKYEMYFSQKLTVSSLTLPSLVFPVKTMWKTVPSSPNDGFIDDVVQTVFAIHTLCEPGDIITFLSSNEDIKFCFAALDAKLDYYQYDDLKVFKIGEDSDENDIQAVFSHSPVRKVFLVPIGYDGLIIPSVLYVIDCGIKKELCFDSKSDINVTLSSFISHATAKVRKELAGVCNIGTCFRLYNKVNYIKDMYPKEHAEIFYINPMHSMVKIFQHRPNIMDAIQFVEPLPNDIQANTIKLLRDCGAIDKNSHLTPFGEKLIKLPFSSIYSRFILSGLVWGFAYEAIILVALFLLKKTIKDVFMESKDEECQKLIDTVKLEFNQLDSDTLTFLNIYKTWKKNGFKKLWCEKNYINYIILKYVRTKVNDIRHIVNECLGENIAEEISEIKDEQDLIQMLFECFQDNLCVFTGHHRIGYQILSSRQLALIHSSSILFGKENPPRFVIYDKLLCTNGYFLSNLTSIPFEFIMEKLQNNSINFSSSDLLEEKLIKRVIEPVGEKVITQVLLKNEGRKIRKIEERIKKRSSAKVVLIEPVLGKGCVTIYAFQPYIDTCFSILEEILKDSTKSIMNEEETRIVYLKNGNSVPVEILWSKGANIQTAKHLLCGIEVVNNPRLLSVAERDLESVNTSSINYTLKLFIPRRICTGEGFINLNNKKDFDKARRLTVKKISVNKTEAEVFVQVSNIKENQLHILDIPPEVSREDLIESFSNLLPEIEFDIELCYLPPFNTTEKELLQIKKQIEENCTEFTNLVNFEVNVSKPEPSSTYTCAFVNVFEERCLDKEVRNLSARKINKMNISCKPLYFSKVKCNPDIYEALKYRIKEEFTVFEQEHLKNFEEKYVKVEPKKCEDAVTIQLLSNDVEIMKAVQMRINCLLDGVKLSKNNFKQINKLFCHGGHVFLKTLEKTFNICIVKNFETKTVRLFGLQKNCNDAVRSIIGFLEDAKNEINRSIILSSEGGNRLLLKEIIMKYGPNLEKFIELHGLRTAALDIRTSCLLLYGKKDNIDKAEECVNELSTSIDLPSICSDSSSEEICPVCLCPAENLTYRLELCGHLYCSTCINFLIEQDKFPIQCSAENCSQDVILGDIKYVLDDEDEKIQELASKSIKNFLERNQDKLFHCPAADCAMFIFKTELTGEKWKCPLCQNFICIKCNAVFHDGYSCDMYQGSKLDPDYSLKVWQETSKKGRRCPKCSIPIEKRSGCNHMTCEKCSCHFCWICGTAFPTGNDVYAHINRSHTGLLFAE